MRGPLGRLLGGFVQLVHPDLCWTCSGPMPAADLLVCPACTAQLAHDPHSTCPRCSSSVGPFSTIEDGCPACRGADLAFDGAVRLAPYDGLLREVVIRMKQPSGEELAEVMGAFWARHAAARLGRLGADAIVPVPLHWTRRWWRGFNQSEVLARALSKSLRVPSVPALRRVRRTPKQAGQQSAAARRDNVRGAFAVQAGSTLRDRTVLLVDDVLTTGATASEAARALRLCRPRRVLVAVLAHGR